MVEMAVFNIQRAITLKVGKQELRFMCSACHLMVLTYVSSFMKICQTDLKIWNGHKKCKRTHTHTKKENYIPHCMHTSYAGDRTRVTVHMFCMFSHGLTFHENMSSGFKLMEQTQKLLTRKGQ